MPVEHVRVIHFVHVVGGKNQNVRQAFVRNALHILVDRVGGAQIPGVPQALGRRNGFNELPELGGKNIPNLADVTVQAQSFVLRQDIDFAESGIQAIGKRQIDQAVDTPERHHRLGLIAGERRQTFARTSG